MKITKCPPMPAKGYDERDKNGNKVWTDREKTIKTHDSLYKDYYALPVSHDDIQSHEAADKEV